MVNVLTKRDAQTSPQHGCHPNQRPIGDLLNRSILNVNKPSGPTSHMVSSYVKDIFGIKKAGHSGTLDPHVTGVLPVALSRATKVLEVLLLSKKEYVAIMKIHKPVSKEQIEKVCKQFSGEIIQMPPVRSAVKRQWRKRNVYYLEILEIDGQNVLFKVGCQAGTYVRKLIHDIGIALGTGAHMAELVRTKAGPFDESQMVTLQDITDAFWYYKEENNEKFLRSILYSVEFAASELPKIWVMDTTVDTLCHGALLGVPGIAKLEDTIEAGNIVSILTLKGELVSIGEAKMSASQIMESKNGIAVVSNKTFMEPNTYPKMSQAESSK